MGYYSAYFVALGSLLAGAAAVHTFYKPNLVRGRAASLLCKARHCRLDPALRLLGNMPIRRTLVCRSFP
jgi:hypothetical protein